MIGLNRDSQSEYFLIKTGLDKLKDDTLQTENIVGKATALDPLVFTQDSVEGKGAVVNSVLGGGGYFAEETDDYAPKKDEAKNASLSRTTFIKEFNKNLSIPRTFMADQQQSAVAKSVRQDVQAWTSTRDRNAFKAYSGGFATNTTIDNAYLFSNSHTNLNGDTVDNLETGALADGTLNSTVNSLRLQLNNTGVLVGYEPKFFLVPSILHKDGMSIAKSVLRAGTGNNDLNYWSEAYPGMKVVYSPFLDGVSTTAYFVGTSMHDVIRYEREAFFSDLVDWHTDPNDLYKYKMRAREAVETLNYVGLVGSTGV